MTLTPVEIQHVDLPRGLTGYRRAEVRQLLEEVYASYAKVWRERGELSDRVEQLEADLVRYRDLENLLRGALVSAERASAELKENAQREADLIVSEAHAEARSITREAVAERERLFREARRARALLGSALATLDVVEPEETPAQAAGVQAA